MKIPHQTVVDDEGKPVSVLLDWDTFQALKPHIESLLEAQEQAKQVPLPDKTADHVEGGDYKSLKDLGIKLPTAKKMRTQAADETSDTSEAQPKKMRRIR